MWQLTLSEPGWLARCDAPPVSERIWRIEMFLRSHRPVVVGIVVCLLILGVGIAVSIYQSVTTVEVVRTQCVQYGNQIDCRQYVE